MPKIPVRSGLLSSDLAILRTPPLRRVRRTTERDQDVASGRAVDLYPDRAIVDVEERPICAKSVESQVVLGRRQRRDGACDRVAALREPGDQLLQLIDAGVELRTLLVDRTEHRVQVVDDVADEFVSCGEVLGERAGGGQQTRQRATLTLQQFEYGIAHLVDLGTVQPLEHRAQSAEQ